MWCSWPCMLACRSVLRAPVPPCAGPMGTQGQDCKAACETLTALTRVLHSVTARLTRLFGNLQQPPPPGVCNLPRWRRRTWPRPASPPWGWLQAARRSRAWAIQPFCWGSRGLRTPLAQHRGSWTLGLWQCPDRLTRILTISVCRLRQPREERMATAGRLRPTTWRSSPL